MKITNVQDFWQWFVSQEQDFYKVIKKGGVENLTENFFDKLEPKLNQLKDGIKYLCGMDGDKADLILTADGYLPNFYIVEELIANAPKLDNWIFQAHKPAHMSDSFGISMNNFNFDTNNIHFYATENEEYPDEINITFVHDEYSEDNEDAIKNGTFIFLENYIGELNFATMIDSVDFIAKADAEKDLIPLTKLNDYLVWREKEFIEKYDGTRYNTDNDNYSLLEGKLSDGSPIFVSVNQDLLQWDAKASHPWILDFCFEYEGNEHGLPEKDTFELMNQIEDELCEKLTDKDGYLFVCRETSSGKRYLNLACKDFINPPKVADEIIKKYEDQILMSQGIYKDKYWQSFERFTK